MIDQSHESWYLEAYDHAGGSEPNITRIRHILRQNGFWATHIPRSISVDERKRTWRVLPPIVAIGNYHHQGMKGFFSIKVYWDFIGQICEVDFIRD